MSNSPLSSKELTRAIFLHKELPRLPFIPYVCSYAAKLRQTPVKEMFHDATVLANSQMEAQKLFGYDAILNIFDPTLEAEACGCELVWEGEFDLPRVVSHPLKEGKRLTDLSLGDMETKGRFPVVLEATKRLSQVMGKEVGIIGAVSGPLTLACHLKGYDFLTEIGSNNEEVRQILNFAGRVIGKIVRAYCECQVDAIILVDETLAQLDSSYYNLLNAAFRSTQNIIRFHNAHSLLVTRGCSKIQQEALCDLSVDGITRCMDISLAELKGIGRIPPLGIADPIPLALLAGPVEPLQEWIRNTVAESQLKGVFLASEWEIPHTIPPENLHRVREIL